jgi:type IV pilus assembly protein PilV
MSSHRGHLMLLEPVQRGFSLVEVMVALAVLGVGLLGIAKIQALAYASTASASQRSLVALEASSLAASMRANRLFWSTSTVTSVTVTITGGTAVIADTPNKGLSTTANCKSLTVPCTTDQMAAYDLQEWADSVRALLPNSVTTVACPSGEQPVVCTIQMAWDERTVGVWSLRR